MAAADFLPQAAEGVGVAGLFLYLARTVLSSDRPLSRGIKEIQKRLDAERERGDRQDTEIDRIQAELRGEREISAKLAAQFAGCTQALSDATQRAERFASENAELRAQLRLLRGGEQT